MYLKLNWGYNNREITNYISFSLILFVILELTNGIWFFFGYEWILSPSSIPKLLWQIVLFCLVSKKIYSLSKNEKLLLLFSLLIIIYGIYKYYNNVSDYIWAVKHLDKLFIVFFVYILLRNYDINLKKVLPILDWIFIGNSLLIIVGLLFNIEFFKSYPFSERFGFSGIYSKMSINDVSLFYLLGNFYMFYQWRNNENSIYKFVIVFGASFLVGTKAIYLQNLFLISYIVLFEKELRMQILTMTVVFTLLLISIYNFSFWQGLYLEKGLLSVITSLRSDLFSERIPNALEQLSVSSLLLGYRDPFPFFVEMDIVDLFLTLGVIGGLLYSYFYLKIIFNFSSKNYYAWAFVICYFILVSISGRYLYSGVNAIYFPLFIYYLKQEEIPND